MRHMKFEDSAILQEYSRIMQEKDELKKIAQVQPAAVKPEDEFTKLYTELQQGYVNEPKRWDRAMQLAKSLDPAMFTALDNARKAYVAGKKDYKKYLLDSAVQRDPFAGIAVTPKSLPTPVPPGMSKQQALSQRAKQADQKAYDVTPKEDMVHEAHPKTSMVEGEVVENLNEQQDADLSVAQKSAQTKKVLVALYKLAKRLKAEKNQKAYDLVKETFLDISKSLKK